jgi:hypothetical protein
MARRQTKRPPATLPPFDDPRWLSVAEAHALLNRHGYPELAALDLTKRAEAGTVRTMRRHIDSGEAERLTSVFWNDHIWSTPPHPPMAVVVRCDIGPTDEYGRLITPEVHRVWFFLFWRPHLEPADKMPVQKSRRATPKATPHKRAAYAVKLLRQIARELGLPATISPGERNKKISDEMDRRGLRVPSARTFARAFRPRKH